MLGLIIPCALVLPSGLFAIDAGHKLSLQQSTEMQEPRKMTPNLMGKSKLIIRSLYLCTCSLYSGYQSITCDPLPSKETDKVEF